MATWWLWTLAAALSLTVQGSGGTKILLLPRTSDSHIEAFIALGESLVEGGGYEVYIMVPSLYTLNPARMKAAHLRVIQYPVGDKDWKAAAAPPGCNGGGDDGQSMSAEDCFNHVTSMTSLGELKARGEAFGTLCTQLLENAEIQRSLGSMGFAHAVVDSHPLVRCYYVLLYKLGVPYSTYMQQYDPWLMRAPALPSFTPSVHMERATEAMGLWERILNLWTHAHWAAFCSLPTHSDSMVSTYAPDKPYRTINQLARGSSIWLADANFLLDYPRPTWPHEYLVGGLTARPASPIPKPLDAFVNPNGTAVDGVVIVNLGGGDAPIPTKTIKSFLDALAALGNNYRIIWQHKGDISPLTPAANIKVTPWLPLNDLLAYEKTKLFITAASSRDQQVALYHGVPMLSVPLSGALRHNAQKARYNRYGLTLDVQTSTTKDILGHVKKLLSTNEYSDSARQASEIWRSSHVDSRHLVNEAITLAVDDKVSHLLPHAMELPWYQYLLVDVGMLACLILGMVLWLSCNTASLSLQKLRSGHAHGTHGATVTNGTMLVTQTYIPTKSFKAKQY